VTQDIPLLLTPSSTVWKKPIHMYKCCPPNHNWRFRCTCECWLLGALQLLLFLCRDWDGSCYQCWLGVALVRHLHDSLLNLVRHTNMAATSTSWNSCEILRALYRLSLKFISALVVTGVQCFSDSAKTTLCPQKMAPRACLNILKISKDCAITI